MSKLIRKAVIEKKLAIEQDKAAGPTITAFTKSGQPLTIAAKKTYPTGTTGSGKGKGKGKKQVIPQAGNSNVIYLGHIPNGFYEVEMRKFFSQFGLVKRLKLFRSAKTNNSKGYAFIEFESSDIASVVSDSMNGYYLSERQLVSNVIPQTKIHDGMFKPPKRKAKDEAGDSEDDSEADSEDGKVKKSNSDVPKELSTIEDLNHYKRSVRNKQKRLKELGIDFEIVTTES